MGQVRHLFVDMNAYFASVEQQVDPSLRGRPVAVVPVMTPSTSCIAASYEAKVYGIKTGTPVHEAMRLCPDLTFIEANTRRYVEFHHRIVEAVESCLHVDQVASIDEMHGRLMGKEQQPQEAMAMAMAVKHAIRQGVGPWVRCSVGLAPNAWLAKVASDMQKPDGLTMILPHQLPHVLHGLALRDLPGIGRNMAARLHAAGITTTQRLCAASVDELSAVWGSAIHGRQWWDQLHGHDQPIRATQRRSVGHSHVLAPPWRSPVRAHGVVLRMLEKAATRLRQLEHRAGTLTLDLCLVDRTRWRRQAGVGQSRDTLTFVRALEPLWAARPAGDLLKVAITLGDLVPDRSATLPLYGEQARLDTLADQIDRLNRKIGRHAVHLGGMCDTHTTAPDRIAFGQIPHRPFDEPPQDDGHQDTPTDAS